MQNQFYSYLNKVFLESHCGFRKGCNAHHCLMKMIVKWWNCLHDSDHAAALPTDLSKAFHCIDNLSLNFLYSYVTDRK